MLAAFRAVQAKRQQASPGQLLDDAGQNADLGGGPQRQAKDADAWGFGLSQPLSGGPPNPNNPLFSPEPSTVPPHAPIVVDPSHVIPPPYQGVHF